MPKPSNRWDGDDHVLIAPEYRGQLLRVIPMLEGYRKYLSNGWTKIEATGRNLHHLSEYGVTLPERHEDGDNESLSTHPTRPTFNPPQRRSLPTGEVKEIRDFEHQREAKEKFYDLKGPSGAYVFALFADMGTGKTKVAIDLINRYYCDGVIDAVLVLAKNGVHQQWVEDVEDDDGTINVAPVRFYTQDDLEIISDYWRGSGRRKLNPALFTSGKELRWLTMNFEAMGFKSGQDAVAKFVKAHKGRVALIGDETHYWKSSNAKRTKAVYRIRNNFRVRGIMTGTPIAKDATDEWSQLKIMDEDILGIRYMTSFRSEYCVMGGFENRHVIGHKNIEQFKEKVAPYTFRVKKEDCLDLPEKQYRRSSFVMSPEQRRVIKEFKATNTFVMPSGEEVFIESPGAVMSKIQEISNGYFRSTKTDEIAIFDNPRIDALKSILEGSDEKAIVWVRYHPDIEILEKEFGPLAVSYHGKMNAQDKSASVRRFIDDPDVRYFVATDAAAEGIDGIQKSCSLAIYYSNSFNSVKRWQSEDRIHRIGMQGTAVYWDLIAKGSIDANVLRALRDKKSISDLILDVAQKEGLKINDRHRKAEGSDSRDEGRDDSEPPVHGTTDGHSRFDWSGFGQG